MHVQFAHAAISKTSDGEASIGVAACAAWPADGVSVEGDSHAGRFAPSSAPFNKENEGRALPGGDVRAHAAPRCEAVVAISIRGTSVRTGDALCDEAFLPRTWGAVQAALEIEAKILAGDGALAGRVADSAPNSGRLRVFRRALCASRGQHEEAGFAKGSDERLRAPVALHHVEDGTRASSTW
jgi:hypothetical protein